MEEMKFVKGDEKLKAQQRYRLAINSQKKMPWKSAIWMAQIGKTSTTSTLRSNNKMNWQIVHRILPTNERLQAQLAAKTSDCALREIRLETHEHIFLGCKYTRPVRDLVIDAWERATGKTMQERGLRTIINMDLGRTLKREQQLSILKLISTYNQAVWKARNIKKLEKKNINSEWIRMSFKQRMGKRKVVEAEEPTEEILKKIKEDISQKTQKELIERGIRK